MARIEMEVLNESEYLVFKEEHHYQALYQFEGNINEEGLQEIRYFPYQIIYLYWENYAKRIDVYTKSFDRNMSLAERERKFMTILSLLLTSIDGNMSQKEIFLLIKDRFMYQLD